MFSIHTESPAARPIVAANDNFPDSRKLQAWPTGKRLRHAGRNADLYLLIKYRELVDMAFGTPANDNWREAPPAPGEEDTRPKDERIDQREMIMNEDGIHPSIEEMRELSGVPWDDELEPDVANPARPVLVRVDKGGASFRHLGGLEFVNGAHLHRYGDLDGDRNKLKKPTELRAPRRPKKRCAPNLIPNTSGTFSLEDQIMARDEVRRIFETLPASVVRLLEHAVGTTTARQLGEAFGKQGKNAERFGVRLFDWAISCLGEAWSPQNADCA